MSANLSRQAKRLSGVFAEMVRRFQFRERDQICCHGLTVSQCYTLEALAGRASMTMGDLAGHLCLKISSVTRVVDALAAGGLVRRVEDPADRRICCVQITSRGRLLVAKIRRDSVEEYEQVLRNVAPESREALIRAVSDLLAAFEKPSDCTAYADGGQRENHDERRAKNS